MTNAGWYVKIGDFWQVTFYNSKTVEAYFKSYVPYRMVVLPWVTTPVDVGAVLSD